MNYREFKPNPKLFNSLSSEEKKILVVLQKVVQETAKLYEKQLNDGFYPKNLSKIKIEEANQKNPSIMSFYTCVEEKNGKIVSTPYHKKYAEDLKVLAELILSAAEVCSNKSFKRYLEARADSLITGNYKEAEILWFDVINYKLDFSVGPFERYLDTMFLRKRAYQAHVAIIDPVLTEKAELVKEVLYATAKMNYDNIHSADIPKKGVNIFVEETVATAGYIADAVFSGEHFPLDLDLMKQYGSRIIIFSPQLKLKFEKLHYPIFKKLFEKRFSSKYSQKLLLEATVYNILLYELGRQLHKFINARETLKELYAPIDEANGFVSGILHGKYLVMKGLITQEELEAIIIIHIVWMFSDWVMNKQSGRQEGYVLGDAVILNWYIENGALMEAKGISWPNFSKIFFQIEELAAIFVNFLQKDQYKEAELFIKKNGSMKNFEKLGKKLETLSLKI